MKTKSIIITIIALLTLWAILATSGCVASEEDNRKQFVKHTLLESSYETQKEAHDKLKTKYDELEDKYIRGLAFEVLWDMGAKSNSATVSLDRIAEREGLTFSERTKVSSTVWKIIDAYGLEK